MKKSGFRRLLGAMLALLLCVSPLMLMASATDTLITIESFSLVLNPELFPAPVAGGPADRNLAVLDAMTVNSTQFAADSYAAKWRSGNDDFYEMHEGLTLPEGDSYNLSLVLCANEGYKFNALYTSGYLLNGIRPISTSIAGDRVTLQYDSNSVFGAYVDEGETVIDSVILDIDESSFPKAALGESVTRDTSVLEAAVADKNCTVDIPTSCWATMSGATIGFDSTESFSEADAALGLKFIANEGYTFSANCVFILNGVAADYVYADEGYAMVRYDSYGYRLDTVFIDELVFELSYDDFPYPTVGEPVNREAYTDALVALEENQNFTLNGAVWVEKLIDGTYGSSYELDDPEAVFPEGDFGMVLLLAPTVGYAFDTEGSFYLNGRKGEVIYVYDNGAIELWFPYTAPTYRQITEFDLTLSPEDIPAPTVGQPVTAIMQAFDALSLDGFHADSSYCGWEVNVLSEGFTECLYFTGYDMFTDDHELLYININLVAHTGYEFDLSDLSGFRLNGVSAVETYAYTTDLDIVFRFPASALTESTVESTISLLDAFDVEIGTDILPEPVINESVVIDHAAIAARFEALGITVGDQYTAWYAPDNAHYGNGDTLDVEFENFYFALDIYAPDGYAFDTRSMDNFKLNGVSAIGYYHYGNGNIELYFDPAAFYAVIGDMNEDGLINATDYALLKRAVLGTVELNSAQTVAGDINSDGEINAQDYGLLKRAVLGTYKL